LALGTQIVNRTACKDWLIGNQDNLSDCIVVASHLAKNCYEVYQCFLQKFEVAVETPMPYIYTHLFEWIVKKILERNTSFK
jgi:hypothetical protein